MKDVRDIITNGCSVIPEFNQHECCNQHDIDYATIGKFRADWKLVKCGWVKANTYDKWYKRIATRTLASTMFAVLTFAGWPAYFNAQKEYNNG